MTGISAPDSFGSPKAVRKIWVSDHANLKGAGTGVMQPVTDGWVWDAPSASWKRFWPQAPAISSISIGPGADWRKVVLSVTADGGVTYFHYVSSDGTNAILLPGTANPSIEVDWFDLDTRFVPGSTLYYYVQVRNTVGTVSTIGTAILSKPPAPATVTRGTLTYSSVGLSWSAVPGATSYRILNAKTGYSLITTTTALSATINIGPSTAYSFVVQAVCTPAIAGASSTLSPYSTAVTFTSPASPGPAPGVYTVRTATNATYQWGLSGGQSPGWRSTADDLYHGDGGSVSTRGQQAGFFFYGSNIAAAFPSGLGSRSISKFEILIHRLPTGGSSSGQTCRWNLHSYASRPSGAPTLYSAYDAGSLAWDTAAWIMLPTSWAASLIAGTRRGIAWGKVAGRYMIADSTIAAGSPNGTLRITVA